MIFFWNPAANRAFWNHWCPRLSLGNALRPWMADEIQVR